MLKYFFNKSLSLDIGNPTILKWARDNGYPWNETLEHAIMYGNFNILKLIFRD